MKITDNRTKKETKFKDIKPGDVFYDPHGMHAYMKIGEYFDRCGILVANAISLATNSALLFEQDEKVKPVNCELVITD